MPNRPCGRIKQHGSHGEINQKQRNALEIGLAERIGDPDEKAAGESPAQAAHTADHDDDEGRNENFRIHSGIEAEHRRRSDPAQSRERHAKTENAGEQCRHVGAKPRRHHRVIDTGPHHGADPAPLQKQPEQERDGKTEADQKQAVGREHAGADMHDALQRLRRRQTQHHAAPHRLHQIKEHEGETEGQQDLIHMAAPIKRPQEQKLEQHTEPDHRDRRQNERQPETAGSLKDR